VHARVSASPSRVAAPRPVAAGARIARWIERELRRHPPRAKSLVVTVWGDALAPHGGAVWLGSLIRLLAPLGPNERLVRTSVYRLAQEGWVEAQQTGRRSLYRLTTSGRQRFEHAYRRIYAPPAAVWDGTWEIVLAPATALRSAERERLKRELGWEGFGAVASGIFVRPAHNHHAPDLAELLHTLHVDQRVVVLRARDAPGLEARSLREYAQDGWDLTRVASEYRAFLARFRVIAEHFHAARTVDPEQAFVVRTLLIHAFRRMTLHDPQLPNEIAPPNWPSPQAYALCRDLYRLLQRPAEEHLTAAFARGNGALPPAAPYFRDRFGGL
jgi:phenylacetic acid degradation operon negative regulatory protein